MKKIISICGLLILLIAIIFAKISDSNVSTKPIASKAATTTYNNTINDKEEKKNTSSGSKTSNKCTIKGNINDKGEKIFHVPGQKYYDSTKIDTAYGERWFCSESEAIAAGWRKSKI